MPTNPPPVLAEIVAHKRAEVASQKSLPQARQSFSQLSLSQRNFRDALRAPGNRFVLEYKKASPSRGAIRPDSTPQEIAAAYSPCADAISVLTDSKFFAGSLDDLEMFREQIPVPILRKDFFVDEYQVLEARRAGADAILLMLSVLDDQEYRRLRDLAHEYAMDVLTEVHTEEECRRAVDLNAQLVGINNRNLKTMQIDLRTTERLRSLLPASCTVISESGIDSRQDVGRLASNVDGFLIGTSLMTAQCPAQQAKSIVYGTVKLCGIQDADTARVAFTAGASYVGFVFCQNSPRFLEVPQAADITQQIPGNYVGVFLNENEEQILSATQQCGLSAVQLHGQESVEMTTRLRQRLSDHVEIWKAISISDAYDISALQAYRDSCTRFVFDSFPTEDRAGGTGRCFDWSLIPSIRDAIGNDQAIFIAGGIHQGNVHELFPFGEIGIDLSSGIESKPGSKDLTKIHFFFERLREYGRTST